MRMNPAHPAALEPSHERSTSREWPVDLAEVPPRRPLLELSVLAGVAALLVVDLIFDADEASMRHIAIEVAAATIALGAAVGLWLRWIAARRVLEGRVTELGNRLRTASADAEKWRDEARQALEGLGAAIERQFDRWALTDAEQAVALL